MARAKKQESPGRSARRGRTAWPILLSLLFACAMASSILLVLSESVQLLRVAVVVALWSAMIGTIAVTKYRRESTLDRAKVGDMQTVYELQLEREIAARREFELTVEEKVRGEVRADIDELAALRVELAAVRRHLEKLLDRPIPDQASLRRATENIPELGGGAVSPWVGERSPRIDAARATPAPRPSGPQFASPDDPPITVETLLVGSESTDPGPVRRVRPAARGPHLRPHARPTAPGSEHPVDPVSDTSVIDPIPDDAATPPPAAAGTEVREPVAGLPDESDAAAGGQHERPERGGADHRRPRPVDHIPSGPDLDAGDESGGGRRARREADGAHTTGRSVAEILASVRAER